LDNAVVEFLLDERANRRSVSNEDIKDKAKEIGRRMRGFEDFQGSDGWVARWKKGVMLALEEALMIVKRFQKIVMTWLMNLKVTLID
jgi:hypothetical protein